MPRRTFGFSHLAWFISGACLVLAIFQVNQLAGIAFCPLAIAPSVSHAQTPTRSAVISGLFFTIFWTLRLLIIYWLLLFCLGSIYNLDDISADVVVLGLLCAVFIASITGGFVGGRTADYS